VVSSTNPYFFTDEMVKNSDETGWSFA